MFAFICFCKEPFVKRAYITACPKEKVIELSDTDDESLKKLEPPNPNKGGPKADVLKIRAAGKYVEPAVSIPERTRKRLRMKTKASSQCSDKWWHFLFFPRMSARFGLTRKAKPWSFFHDLECHSHRSRSYTKRKHIFTSSFLDGYPVWGRCCCPP